MGIKSIQSFVGIGVGISVGDTVSVGTNDGINVGLLLGFKLGDMVIGDLLGFVPFFLLLLLFDATFCFGFVLVFRKKKTEKYCEVLEFFVFLFLFSFLFVFFVQNPIPQNNSTKFKKYRNII